MTSDELLRYLESLLFVAAEPAEIAQLAAALDVKASELEAALADLSAQYRARGLRVQRRGQRVALASAPESAPYVEKFLGLNATTRLSQAALETLAIIAYRQPITRAEIEALRGVDCDGVLRTLTARQLIAEVERLDTVGHPILYGTTFEFMRYFGLQSLDQMPPLWQEERAAEPNVEAVDDDLPTANGEQAAVSSESSTTNGEPSEVNIAPSAVTGDSLTANNESQAADGESSSTNSEPSTIEQTDGATATPVAQDGDSPAAHDGAQSE